MHQEYASPIPICLIIVLLISFFLFLSTKTYAQIQPIEKDAEWIKLSSPSETATVIEKKPLFKCLITIPFDKDILLVTLDQTDVTAIINIVKGGFEFKPLQILSSGQHNLSVTLKTPDKKEYKRNFSFIVRHSKLFEEMSSTNEAGILYEGMTQRKIPEGQTDNTPYSKIEGNISSNSKIREKGFEGTLTGNIRYIEQSESLTPPMFKGFTIPNYLLSVRYQTEKSKFLAETGDVQINETLNTVALSRRGLRFNAEYGNFRLNAFSVKAQQVSGLRNFTEDTGFAFDPADKIEGASGEVDFIDKKAIFKVIHVRGQDQGTSFGSWSAGGGKKGDTTGLLLKTDFFSQKLKTEIEYDFGNFDQDTSDTLPKAWDKAYSVKIGGQAGGYNYEGLYEFFGPQFSSIGNTGVPKDREGFTLKGGSALGVHSVNLSLSRYNDNLKMDPLLPTLYTYQGGVDYNFSKFKGLPMGLSYQTTLLESKNEPAEVQRRNIRTDNLTGRINYQKDALNLGFNINYAAQKDQYVATNDNTNVTLTFMPAYSSEKFSVAPSFSLNHLSYDQSKVVIDTYTVNLNIRGKILDKKVDYDIAYNFNKAMNSDYTTSNETTNINFRIGYLLAKQIMGLVNPTIGIRGNYSSSNDLISDIRSEKNFVFLFFSTNVPISF
jgi:hypothetical protein